MLEAVFKYIILCIACSMCPSTANAMGFKIYLYVKAPGPIRGFEDKDTTRDTILCQTLQSTYREYVMNLLFDNVYNTRYIKAHQVAAVARGRWIDKSYTPNGLNAEPGEETSPFGKK